MEEFFFQKQKAKNEEDYSQDVDFHEAINETLKLWRKYHLSYNQTKYLVREVRRMMDLKSGKRKSPAVNRLTMDEANRLIESAYDRKGKYGLLVKTLFMTGARVNEFINIKIEDVFFQECEIHLFHGKGGKHRSIPILPSLAQEIKTYLNGRTRGYLFESNRNHKFTTRRIEQIVREYAVSAGITKKVFPHLLRHSVSTILRQKGMAIDLIQKFLGHAHLCTTQIYVEVTDDMLKSSYKEIMR